MNLDRLGLVVSVAVAADGGPALANRGQFLRRRQSIDQPIGRASEGPVEAVSLSADAVVEDVAPDVEEIGPPPRGHRNTIVRLVSVVVVLVAWEVFGRQIEPLFMSYPAVSNVQYRLSEADRGTLIKFQHVALGLIQDGHRKNVSTGWSSLQERIRTRAEGGRS